MFRRIINSENNGNLRREIDEISPAVTNNAILESAKYYGWNIKTAPTDFNWGFATLGLLFEPVNIILIIEKYI